MAENDALTELYEKASAALRDEVCCGAIFAGERVFCDDKRLDVPHEACACKARGKAVVSAILMRKELIWEAA